MTLFIMSNCTQYGDTNSTYSLLKMLMSVLRSPLRARMQSAVIQMVPTHVCAMKDTQG